MTIILIETGYGKSILCPIQNISFKSLDNQVHTWHNSIPITSVKFKIVYDA